jgi:hypothetical protein
VGEPRGLRYCMNAECDVGDSQHKTSIRSYVK